MRWPHPVIAGLIIAAVIAVVVLALRARPDRDAFVRTMCSAEDAEPLLMSRDFSKVTPETYNARIHAAIDARDKQIRAEKRAQTIAGHLNGLYCPKCGAPLGDLDVWSMAGIDPINAPVGKIVTSSRWVGCSQCEYEGWRIDSAYEWTGTTLKPFDLSQLTEK